VRVLSASVEEKRLAIEIIATLVYIKDTMADLILKPAGVPADIYKPIIHKREEETGKALSPKTGLSENDIFLQP
jgi:hypothetical protein